MSPSDGQRLLRVMPEKGDSERTAQYGHAVLRRALNQAVAWDLVTRNVATRVPAPRPRQDPERVHALRLDDARAVLQAAEPDRLYALYLILITMGLRKGEALGLQWTDLDLA